MLLLLLAGGVAACARGSIQEPVAGEWIALYFTGDSEGQAGGVDEDLVAFIETASERVDVAAYQLNLATVTDALIQARQEGVEVRFVTDGSTVGEEQVSRLRMANIPVVARPEEDRGLMHDKFVVVDGSWVWTGSYNLTENGTYRNDNNAVLVASRALAEDYETEFDEMFGGLFGPSSPANTPYTRIEIGGQGREVEVEVYFAPEDPAEARILDLLSSARSSVRFMAFVFTSEPIADRLIRLADRGILVQGIVEARSLGDPNSQVGRLRAAGVDVVEDGNPYVMHHKVMIIDDDTVVLGSYNFSASAEEANDENLLIIHDPEVAARFLAEFGRLLQEAQAGGVGIGLQADLGTD